MTGLRHVKLLYITINFFTISCILVFNIPLNMYYLCNNFINFLLIYSYCYVYIYKVRDMVNSTELLSNMLSILVQKNRWKLQTVMDFLYKSITERRLQSGWELTWTKITVNRIFLWRGIPYFCSEISLLFMFNNWHWPHMYIVCGS